MMLHRINHNRDSINMLRIFLVAFTAALSLGPSLQAFELPPADKCVEFYAMLLRAGVNAELHVFSKGSHGFDPGAGRRESAAIWTRSFVARLSDCDLTKE